MYLVVAATEPGTIGTVLALIAALGGSAVSLVKVRQRRDLTEAEAEEIRDKLNVQMLNTVGEQLGWRDREIERLRKELREQKARSDAEIAELKERVRELELHMDEPPPELA